MYELVAQQRVGGIPYPVMTKKDVFEEIHSETVYGWVGPKKRTRDARKFLGEGDKQTSH